jgi:hypothetical protein
MSTKLVRGVDAGCGSRLSAADEPCAAVVVLMRPEEGGAGLAASDDASAEGTTAS